MAWEPKQSILISRAIATNLLTYFAANQVEALAWANANAVPVLKPIAKISESVANRANPVFPAIAFSDDNDAVAYGDDILKAGYSVTFELMVQNKNADAATTQARIYLAAFVSMIVNCPRDSLELNTGAVSGSAVLQTIETGFDPIQTNEMQNDFMQQFQIRAIYTLAAGSF